MTTDAKVSAVLALASVLASAGCIRPWGPEDVRRDLSREAGVSLDREMGLTVTRTGMMLARWGMRVAGEDEIPLAGVRRVEVGVYRVMDRDRGVDDRPPLELPRFEGWESVVSVHEDDQDVLMLAELRDEEIRRILLVVAESDEWVIVRIRGDLRRVIEDAIRLAFDEAERPELYETSEREPGWERREPDPDET